MGSKVYFADFQSYKLIYFLNVRRLSGLSGKLENNPVFALEKPSGKGSKFGGYFPGLWHCFDKVRPLNNLFPSFLSSGVYCIRP